MISLGLKLLYQTDSKEREKPQNETNITTQNIFTDGWENTKDKILGDNQMLYLFYCLASDYKKLSKCLLKIHIFSTPCQNIVRNFLQYRRNVSTKGTECSCKNIKAEVHRFTVSKYNYKLSISTMHEK